MCKCAEVPQQKHDSMNFIWKFFVSFVHTVDDAMFWVSYALCLPDRFSLVHCVTRTLARFFLSSMFCIHIYCTLCHDEVSWTLICSECDITIPLRRTSMPIASLRSVRAWFSCMPYRVAPVCLCVPLTVRVFVYVTLVCSIVQHCTTRWM